MRERRRGGVLFEVMVALAIFVGAGSFVLGATRQALTALDRGGRETLAADLACSRLAELRAGVLALADLRDDQLDRVGSVDVEMLADEGWTIRSSTQRSAVEGAVLVEITVSSGSGGDRAGGEPDAVSFTIRGLVPVAPRRPAEPYEDDDLVRDLPEAAS